jgi:hypothetical protein
MRFVSSILIASAFVIGNNTVGAIQEPAPSQNYLETLTLPRAGEAASDTHSDLEKIVGAHNQKLTQNPAAKNRNRIVYLSGAEQYKAVRFPVASNTPVIDGSGKTMGHLSSQDPRVEINFGQHKLIDGEDHVMVFAAQTAGSFAVTGWIARSALLASPERSQFAEELSTNVADTAALGDSPEVYQVVCGDPKPWDAGRLKILPNVDDRRNKHEAASDYVERPGRFCYLLTSLPGQGGVATDTLSNGVLFIASAGMPHVELPLYLPADATSKERDAWSAGKLAHAMEFRYGRVGTRYGWITSADLRPVSQRRKDAESK